MIDHPQVLREIYNVVVVQVWVSILTRPEGRVLPDQSLISEAE